VEEKPATLSNRFFYLILKLRILNFKSLNLKSLD